MWSRLTPVLLALSLGASFAAAQKSAPAPQSSPVDNKFIHQRFGDSCSAEPSFAPMIADLNGDGVEDIVIVARCKNPLIDQADKNYKVVDPMNSFFGYGNPAITTSFAPDDPKLRGVALLVIHGAGPEAWRSDTPLSKFVIINLPVKTLTLKRMKVRRKKFANAIYVEEASGDQMTSAIFWDGKKYRYEPLGSSME
ncbi:MAG TPA: hypothetical protein VHV29_19705 [Terriglobales bacterium]|jgi:hypothetical protein|nr:hypothetical protein [Terriglobales bacterium]